MSLKTYDDIEQGTAEWHKLRTGVLTASTIGQLITPKTVKVSSSETARGFMRTLAAERITGYSEPISITADMERGTLDEPLARDVYSEHFAPAVEVGFMIRDDWGFQIGYSPDGLVGDDGLIEIKSRRQKKHLTTILADEVPIENMAQIQAGLLVSGRAWCDYVSYCGGMPLYVKRVFPDERWQEAIIAAAAAFEHEAAQMIAAYESAVDGLPSTTRIDHFQEIVIK